MKDFGVIVICCDQDYALAKGVCASIRYFLGDVPIALLVDGDFSVQDAVDAYGVQVISRKTMQQEVLIQRSFGWGTTRMIAFWESPFEHFLIVDADVAVWGDLRRYAQFDQYDLIIDQPTAPYTEAMVQEFFFDLPRFENLFPNFDWRDRPFVCPAVIFGTRGIFPLEEYLEILDLNDQYPGMFKYGDMGFLNFMIFRAADQGRLRLGQMDIQYLVCDFPPAETAARFPINEPGPQPQGEDAVVIHWAAEKPRITSTGLYAAPMNFFRRKFLQDATGKTGAMATLTLQLEDLQSKFWVYKNKARKKIKALLP